MAVVGGQDDHPARVAPGSSNVKAAKLKKAERKGATLELASLLPPAVKACHVALRLEVQMFLGGLDWDDENGTFDPPDSVLAQTQLEEFRDELAAILKV
jgi:hypothetical protein